MTRESAFSTHVGELRRHLGTRKELHAAEPLSGLIVVDARVASGADVRLDAVVESIPDGVVVTGTVKAPWEAVCRRCLTEVTGELETDVREIFEVRPTEGETWPLSGDRIELEDLVRETVLLSLPLAPLCTEACRGPAPDVFPALPEGEGIEGDASGAGDEGTAAPGDAGKPTDPRWAALDQLRLEE